MAAPLVIGGTAVAAGSRQTVELSLGRLYTHTEMRLSVHVIHGRRPGPRLLVCGAIHGDEINGVEIVRRLVQMRLLRHLRGSLLLVPVVNVYGFVQHTRTLPDRRDLNRSFPGSPGGSLAAALAYRVTEDLLEMCTHGIDLHTGANHRTNLPQVRADLSDAETAAMARAFGAPVVLDARLRDGSLRAAAGERGRPWLTYEGGEALRFDEFAIRAGVRGILAVMRQLDMLPSARSDRLRPEPLVVQASSWVRAPASGIVSRAARLGQRVRHGDRLCSVSDPFGAQACDVTATVHGVVIGRLNLPLVHQGDALFHLAELQPQALQRPDLAALLDADFTT